MKTTITRDNGTTILALSGRLDSNTAPDLEKQLQEILQEPNSNLIFDFNDLDYISSAGLRVVLNTAKAFRTAPCKFVACNMQDHVLEVFEISGFNTIITICKTIDDSMSTLNQCAENKNLNKQ